MEERTDDVIREESEENQSFTTDSFADERELEQEQDAEQEDYTSLAFERDLELNSKSYRRKQQEMMEKERQEMERERKEMEERFRKQEIQLYTIKQERDNFKRQVSDLKATCEYQEARMEGKGETSSGDAKPRRDSDSRNWDRRSLRRKTKEKMRDRRRSEDENMKQVGVGGEEMACGSPVGSPLPASPLPNLPALPPFPPASSRLAAPGSDFASKCLEFELEIEKINSHVEHLKSQNKVLNLALEESKSTCDSLTELLGKYESNNTALQLSLSYCDSMIESYDVLVALLETVGDETRLRADRTTHRKKAETVARHLLSRAERRPDSGLASASHLDTTWEDSSGYTTSTCSTSSSGGMEHEQDSLEEHRIREYISQLKVGRAGVQATVLELESVHNLLGEQVEEGRTKVQHTQEEMEVAVLLQEICSIREERADIRAKLYLVSKEKEGLELELSLEKENQRILQTRLQIEQEKQYSTGNCTDEREIALQARVQNLLKTLEKVSKNSELRQKQSLDLIEDLKRANSVLTSALDQAKKKYQNKVKKLELRMMGQVSKTDTVSSASICSSNKS